MSKTHFSSNQSGPHLMHYLDANIELDLAQAQAVGDMSAWAEEL